MATERVFTAGALPPLNIRGSVTAVAESNQNIGATLDAVVVDGVTLSQASNHIVLLVGQTDATENGIYDVNSGVPTRHTSYDSGAEFEPGMGFHIQQGDSNAEATWFLGTLEQIVVDTTAQDWFRYDGIVGFDTIPTEATAGARTQPWYDTSGRQVIAGYDQSNDVIGVIDQSPIATTSLNQVNLNASTASSENGAAVNVEIYSRKTVYVTVSVGTTVDVTIQHSPTGAAPWFDLDTKTYTAAADDSFAYTSHMPYMRTITASNTGCTVTTTITGRGI